MRYSGYRYHWTGHRHRRQSPTIRRLVSQWVIVWYLIDLLYDISSTSYVVSSALVSTNYRNAPSAASVSALMRELRRSACFSPGERSSIGFRLGFLLFGRNLDLSSWAVDDVLEVVMMEEASELLRSLVEDIVGVGNSCMVS